MKKHNFYNLQDFYNNYKIVIEKKSSILRDYVNLWYDIRNSFKDEKLYKEVNDFVMGTQILALKFEKTNK